MAMLSNSQPSIGQLFTSFFRLGVTAFGGPSMIAYIRKMAVEKKRWLDGESFSDGVALCQMLPGATAMQAAAYVGLKTRGVPGASVSFIGFALPAFILMLTFAVLYTYTNDLPYVISAFSGLQAIIVSILINATSSFGRTSLKDWKALAIACTAAALFGFKVNPILVILLAAAGGAIFMTPKSSTSSHPISSGEALSHIKPLLLLLSATVIGFIALFFFKRHLFNLAFLMFRIDLFAFGGGFSSLPLMFHEIVEIRHWIDSQTFMNGIVLGQVTPGPIVITATFVGYLKAGLMGGIVATIGIFLPSFILLVGITPYFERLRTSPYFNKIISGVLCSFIGLLLTVTIRFALDIQWDLSHMLLASGALVALILKIDIIWVVLIGTIISVIVFARFLSP